MKFKEEDATDKEVEFLFVTMESLRLQWINMYGFVAYIHWGGNCNARYSETSYYWAVLPLNWYSEDEVTLMVSYFCFLEFLFCFDWEK